LQLILILLQAHGRRGSICVASRLSVLPSPEKTAVIQSATDNKPFSVFEDSSKTPSSNSKPLPFSVFCDDEPAVPNHPASNTFSVFECKESGTDNVCRTRAASAAVAQNPSPFAVFCDEPETQSSVSKMADAVDSGKAKVAAASTFAVFCDEDKDDYASSGDNSTSGVNSTPQKDMNASLASLHWSPLSCIAEESTMIDGRTSLLDGSMCKGIRSVGRSSRKRRFSGTDFGYDDTEILPPVVKCAEPYTDIERSRVNRVAMGMLLKHPGLFGQSDVVFNQPFAFKAAKGKTKEKFKAFGCAWDVLESLGKGGFGTVEALLIFHHKL
jgi:hypothetical protein